MNNDDFNNKNNKFVNQEENKKENLEENLLKSSTKGKPVDSEKGNEQNSLRNADNNNANIDSGNEYSGSKPANESDNLSANTNNITNSVNSDNSKSNKEINNQKNNIDHSLDIAVLNEINKACQLSMNNISYLANMVNDKAMRKELVAAYSQYSNIILQINQRFESYGEVPDEVSIKLKLIGMSSIRAETCRDKSNSHIAEIMVQGTVMGIIKCRKILNAQLEIDKKTVGLLNTFNNFQIQNVQKFCEFL